MISKTATLKLFNAIEVSGKKTYNIDWNLFSRGFENGFILEDTINPTNETLKLVEQVLGIGGAKLNASFHKSWEKIANSSLQQLVIEQIIHYITVYGFESLGIFDSRHVYVPAEKLEIPEVTENIPLTLIRGLTKEQILFEVVKIGSSGIALSSTTLDSLMSIVESGNFDSNFVTDITNREFYTRLCDFYEIVPSEPVQYLRYVIQKLTGESLLIKNNYLISKIKLADRKTLDSLLEYAPEDLASIFLRFKPLFLAMKSVSRNKTFFNQLRKKSVYMHKTVGVDYLNDITNQISNNTFSIRTFKKALENYPVWRKIRLAYALNNRLGNSGSIVYNVRNGKSWATEFAWNGSTKDLEKVLNYTLESIVEDIRPNVEGKTFFIPENIHYALPSTEKQFVGNVPANTYVSVSDNLVVGVHWYDGDATHIDIDLSLLTLDGKYGWDRNYRSSNRDVLFSGDMTSAPLPNGATELFYLAKGVSTPMLLNANYYNYNKDFPVDCQLVVASENVSIDFTNSRIRGYMINPNNIVMSQSVTVNKKQNTVGFITNVAGESRVYFSNFSVGNSITSSNDVNAQKTLEFFTNTCLNTIALKDILEMAGANVVSDIPEEGDFVDFRPEALDKNSIIQLFAKEQQ